MSVTAQNRPAENLCRASNYQSFQEVSEAPQRL